MTSSHNHERAERGRDLIEYYNAEETYALIEPEDFRAAAVDIITDVMHALKVSDHNALEATEMAQRHYLAELADASTTEVREVEV